MPSIPLLGRFFGNTVSNAAGYAAGGATARILHPRLQSVANEGWELHPDLPIDAGVLASGVSQGQVPADWAAAEAKRTGVNGERFSRLVSIANTGPGVPAAFDLWRRGIIGEPGFRRAAKRQGIEQEWIDDLVRTFHVPLDPADLARGIHRGLVPDPGLLKGNASPGPGKVEAYPHYDIDALAEALVAGLDRDHLGVLVGLQGNPMGAHEAAQALFRGVIEQNDYLRAIAEGNTRNEWADALLEQSRQIPTARDFFENALRGYHDFQWALEQAKRHGMTEADATVIYQNQGRPMAIHQITTGLARGGKFMPEQGEMTDDAARKIIAENLPPGNYDLDELRPFLASIVEGSVKPAYYDLALANRYTLPGTFALRQLVQSGDLTEAEGEQLLLETGWEPTLAAKVAAKWAQGASATTTSASKKAETSLLTALHSAYVNDRETEATARDALTFLAVEQAEQDRTIAVWNRERRIVRSALTAAQIKKAIGQPNRDRAWALERLAELGYTQADAETFLSE